MKNIQTEIIIDAPSSVVWTILTDNTNYHKWNPFIISSEGIIKENAQLTNTILLEGQSTQTFKPVVLEVKQEESFRWLGSLFVKGLFDGEHYFEVKSISKEQTKLIHGENFSGFLSGLILKMIGEKTKDGFLRMNEALKKEVENIYRSKF